MLITIIVPCYNENESLPYFYKEICEIAECIAPREVELLFVNDGSKDNTMERLRGFAKQDTRVRYLSFSRNFGKEAAMYAGLEYAKGEYVAIMDADLQDPPRLLLSMLEELDCGKYDCVATRRINRRGEPKIRSFFARRFYHLINKISETKFVDGARDFRLMTRQMTDAILEVKEFNRFSKGIFGWVGFETKWSVWKLFRYSFDGIVAFSTVLLAMISFFGLLLSAISLLSIVLIIIRQFIWENLDFGWPSMICIILLLSGLQLLCLGIVSQYLAKTYLEIKSRPIYIIKESNNETFRKNV